MEALGIGQYYHQQAIDTTTPSGKAMIQMCVVFAEFERGMITERIHAGLKRAKDDGKTLGRPRAPAELEQRVRAELSKGYGIIKVVKMLGVGNGTVQRIKDETAVAQPISATRPGIGEAGNVPSVGEESRQGASPDPQPPRTLPRLDIGIHPVESVDRPASSPAADVGGWGDLAHRLLSEHLGDQQSIRDRTRAAPMHPQEHLACPQCAFGGPAAVARHDPLVRLADGACEVIVGHVVRSVGELVDGRKQRSAG
jgi:hypothetical protein